MRALAGSLTSGISSEGAMPIFAAEFALASGPFRISTLPFNFALVGGNEFFGVGDFGSVEIGETLETNNPNITLRLSAINPALIGAALGEKMRGRNVTLYFGWWSTGPSSLISWKYTASTVSATAPSASGPGELLVECVSAGSSYRDSAGGNYTDVQHKLIYPADRFFEFAIASEYFETKAI